MTIQLLNSNFVTVFFVEKFNLIAYANIQRVASLASRIPRVKNPEYTGNNPELSSKNPELSCKNPESTSKSPEFCGKNMEPLAGIRNPLARNRNQQVGIWNPLLKESGISSWILYIGRTIGYSSFAII